MSPPPSSDPAAVSPDVGLPALERLRARIESAVAEIERLRAENVSLAERVRELAEDAVTRGDGDGLPTLTLDGDPGELRKQVEAFIEAIDQILVEPSTPVGEAEPAADGEPSSESAS